MKIVSWNVNGLRACVKKGFFDYFNESDADVFCMQEVKMEQKMFDYELPNYFQYWNPATKKGYSGTAVFSKKPALDVIKGIDNLNNDEGRILTLEYEDYYIVNCYSPHSQRQLNRLEYKRTFDKELTQYIVKLKDKKSVVLCGDLNIAHQEIDLKNYKNNKENAGFTIEEREDFDEMLKSGFIDSYRYKYPTETGVYTWWSYRKGVRDRNIGWRIDYIITSNDRSRGGN